MQEKIKNLFKRGDTIIEVTFAITIFSLISVITIQLMDRDVAVIQSALETEMARNEIDAQAEALRFIHNAYLSERELSTNKNSSDKNKDVVEYRDLWAKLSRDNNQYINSSAGSGLANIPSEGISEYLSASDCKTFYNNKNDQHSIFNYRAFVINTRKIDPSDISGTIIDSSAGNSSKAKFIEAKLNPRIVYSKSKNNNNDDAILSEVDPNTTQFRNYTEQNKALYNDIAYIEGIWVIAVRDYREMNTNATPEFYDFHIRTCWYAPGNDRPSTIGTTIRLYNPELIEDQR